MSRRQKWVLWPIAALVALAVIVALVFDWNWLKGPLESRISSELKRDFKIDGELDVDLSLHPRITLTDLHLANPAWASDEPMLTVARAQAVVDLPALLHGEIRLPEVTIEQPVLRLETRPDGPPNWQFSDEQQQGPPTVPQIDRLRITSASVDYLEHGSGRHIPAQLQEITGTTAGRTSLEATGTLGDKPLHLAVDGSAIEQLWSGGEPYAAKLALTLDETDLGGDLKVELGGTAPVIDATLHSDQVRLSDVAWLANGPGTALAAPGAALEQAATALEKAKTEQPDGAGPRFDFDQLPDLDLDLDYTIARLDGPEVALQDLDLKGSLHDHLPTVALTASGTYRDQPVVVDARAGPAEGGGREKSPYRIDADVKAGQTTLTASGGIAQPQQMQGLDVELSAASPDLTELLRELGLPAPQLPQLELHGRLLHEGKGWRLEQAYAQIGESQLSGELGVDLSGSRPVVSASLQSERLRMADFVPAPEGGEAKNNSAPSTPLIENGDINLEALPAIDADLELHASYVELPDMVFDRLDLNLQLRDRVAVIDAKGEGKFRQQPLNIELRAGTEDSLARPDAPYPLELALATRETTLQVKGTAARPLGFTGLDVDVALKGPDLAQLGEILQLPLPTTPPYDLAGKVTHQAEHQRWNLIALDGTVGDSDLEGDVSFELSGERPTLVAKLRSDKVDFDDLGVLVGAPADTEAGETASPAQEREAAAAEASEYVLPDAPFNVPELRAIDARVSFEGKSIQAKKLPLENMALEFTLEDGRLRFEPLRFGLGDGEFEAVMNLDSGSGVLDGEFDLTLQRVKLNQLLARFDIEVADIELEQEGAGTFGGRAELRAKGKSIHELAASADGQVAVVMDGGRINALIVEAIGLDIGEALSLLASDTEGEQSTMVPLQCLVGQFKVESGVMKTEALVLRTSDSTVTGAGEIDLGKERLAMELLAHPQDASALTASTPVRIEGTFKKPEIDLVSEELTEKSLAALALGIVLPVVGAILPFIETGEEDKGLSCAALIRNAENASDMQKDLTSGDGLE